VPLPDSEEEAFFFERFLYQNRSMSVLKVAIVYNKKNIDKHDVINVFGMITKEHYSRKTVEKVAQALEKGGHSVKIIEGGMNFIDDMKEFMPKVVSGEIPGMVFNMAYGIQGQNRYTHVPAMLEMLGIPYVGSGPEAHAVVQDKVMTKVVLQKNGIATPNSWVFTSPDDTFDDLVFPVIVKPKMESTSMGMEVVHDWGSLRDAVGKQLEKYSQEILVEQFVAGREFAVGLLGNGSHVEVLPIVEMDFRGDPNRIQTITDKKSSPVDKICPADLTGEQEAQIRDICVKAFKKLGLNDFTRVDLRMGSGGDVYILELNSMASLGQTGSYYVSAKTAGYTYDSLINKILDVAAVRYFGESYLHHEQAADAGPQPLRAVIRSYLRSHHDTNEKLLEHLVNINSSVYNIEEVNKIGGIISKRLEHMGFKTSSYHEFDVGNTVYAANHGSDQNDVLLLGHLDTWYTNQDFSPFYRVGGKLYGSGIAESKGGLVVMLSALQALRFARRLRKIRCGILLTTDDSVGGRFSKKLVHDTAEASRHIIETKWGLDGGGIATSCSGITKYHIDMLHVRDPTETIKDVIPDMCKKVSEWKRVSAPLEDARIVISRFKAQTSFGRSPDYGSLTLTSRYVTESQGERIDSELHRIAKKRDGSKLDTHIATQVRRNPVESTESIRGFYDLIAGIAKQADLRVCADHRYASSSLGDVLQDRPMVGSMGPIGVDYRTPNEHIIRDSMIDRAMLLALTLSRIADGRGREG